MYIYYLKQQDLNQKIKSYFRKIDKGKKAHSPQISDVQKELIVEIIRVLDKNLELCFPEIKRETFLSQFGELIAFEQTFQFPRNSGVTGIDTQHNTSSIQNMQIMDQNKDMETDISENLQFSENNSITGHEGLLRSSSFNQSSEGNSIEEMKIEI